MERNGDRKSTLRPELAARLKQLPEEDVTFVPRVEQPEEGPSPEPRHPNRVWRGKKRPPSSKTFPWLDEHFLEDARAGATDADLARWSGLSLATVVRWRRSRGIRKQKDVPRRAAPALNLLGVHHGDVLHRTEDSSVNGLWVGPEYVLRKPLKYGELCRHIHFLHGKLGSSTKLIASSLGIREQDVATALSVYDTFLEKNGRPCDWCGFPTLKTDRYCSKHCWDTAKKEMGDR